MALFNRLVDQDIPTPCMRNAGRGAEQRYYLAADHDDAVTGRLAQWGKDRNGVRRRVIDAGPDDPGPRRLVSPYESAQAYARRRAELAGGPPTL
jgi:hypothetical protein